MSELDSAIVHDGGQSPSAGALLREAREAAGLHIAALAVSLKVPVKKMEALEQDRYDLLPDAVFVRALASSVCRILKVDPTEVLARLPQSDRPRLAHPGVGINTPFRPSAGKSNSPSLWTHLSRPAVLVGFVFVLGALVLILLPSFKHELTTAKPDTVNTVTQGVFPPSEPAGSDAGQADAAALTSPVDPAVAAAAAGALPAAAAVLPVPAAPASVPVAGAAALPAVAAASAAAVSADLVSFQAKGESWVEVKDARGTVVLRRMLTSGDVAAASGALPLAAVVGRADATLVHVRGKPLDLTPLTRDNVARFEVK